MSVRYLYSLITCDIEWARCTQKAIRGERMRPRWESDSQTKAQQFIIHLIFPFIIPDETLRTSRSVPCRAPYLYMYVKSTWYIKCIWPHMSTWCIHSSPSFCNYTIIFRVTRAPENLLNGLISTARPVMRAHIFRGNCYLLINTPIYSFYKERAWGRLPSHLGCKWKRIGREKVKNIGDWHIFSKIHLFTKFSTWQAFTRA